MKTFIVVKQYHNSNIIPSVVAWFDNFDDADTYARLSMTTDTSHKYWVYGQV